jgi:membrane protein implicated in regulation of membrane protease activity
MNWWLWIVIGLVLLAAEMLTPGGFFVIFFAAGALLVGLLGRLGFLESSWAQILCFSVFSIGSMLALRRRMLGWTSSASIGMDNLVGELAVPSEELQPGATGKGELRGSSWTVRNADPRTLASGQRCRVERVEGLTLWLKAE